MTDIFTRIKKRVSLINCFKKLKGMGIHPSDLVMPGEQLIVDNDFRIVGMMY